MFWPFARRKSRPPARGANIEAIYGMIVAQARLPYFYARVGVPDTVNGRFDMIVLHLWMVLRRLRALGAPETAQALFDHFCTDMEGNLREMGVGDLTVPKRMTAFGEAFYGRSAAYDEALTGGARQLATALARNVFAAADAEGADEMARYARASIRGLDTLEANAMASGRWQFPAPDAIRTEDHAES